MPSTPLKNIIIAGATGRVGAPILASLLAEPTFNITILTRANSTAVFPPNISLIRVSDDFTLAELTNAFNGQDAAVIATSATPATNSNLPFRFIDAAVAAGVKRFIPSEFGLDNLDPQGRKMSPVYDAKGKMLEYLIKKCEESEGKLTWTSVCCGSWADWALNPPTSGGFYNISIPTRSATIYDSGTTSFSMTTLSNIGIAVSRILLTPSATANQQVFLSDFVSTPLGILAELERQIGVKFEVEHKVAAPELKELRAKVDDGDWDKAYDLLALTFVADVGKELGYDFEKGKEVWNEKLGLPVYTLEQVVRTALELANKD
ncbi:NAD(P)-binding protein [Melanomma pulvis-pyrius CBS 109.77]|uniref:NAD(P)-binding protein n=1 Tax=Melanomma pulvis-pyrius CBS 109.77 TaxID=1314802 RepID=A0A6A6X1F5_9PLEO|nr:NAD(P)-binding protein [Melanomma pulvis-pyrius CBS 109.77]